MLLLLPCTHHVVLLHGVPPYFCWCLVLNVLLYYQTFIMLFCYMAFFLIFLVFGFQCVIVAIKYSSCCFATWCSSLFLLVFGLQCVIVVIIHSSCCFATWRSSLFFVGVWSSMCCCFYHTFIVLLLPNVHHVFFPFIVWYYHCSYIVLLVGVSLKAKKIVKCLQLQQNFTHKVYI